MKNKKYIFCITLFVAIFALFKSSVIVHSVTRALGICVKELIPAVFFFLIFATFASKCNLLSDVPKIISLPLSKIFGIRESLVGYAILGILCGYPSCSIAMGEMYKNKLCTKSEAENMTAIFSCPSVSFIIVAVGSSFFGKTSSGILILISILITTIITSRIFKKLFPCEAFEASDTSKRVDIVSSFTVSVKEASLVMLEICGFVVIFSALSDIMISIISPSEALKPFIFGLFEVTSGVFSLNAALGNRAMIYAGIILGWSGISILAQISAISKSYGFSAKKYLYAKLLFTFILPAVIILLMLIFPDAVPVFSNPACYISKKSNVIIAGVFLYTIFKSLNRVKSKI